MTKDSPTEKLLTASGLQKNHVAPQTAEQKVEEMERLFKGMMEDVKKAATLAREAHGRGESMIESLKKYCSETLPKQMVQAIDEVAEQGVQNSLKPLDAGVCRAVADLKGLHNQLAVDLKSYRETFATLPWYRLWDITFLALGIGVTMGFLVRCQFIGDKIDENKRYEVWGRKIYWLVEQSDNVKAKKNFYDWAGHP
jgi:hypothetical protein